MSPDFKGRAFVRQLIGTFNPDILTNLRDRLDHFERLETSSPLSQREHFAQKRGELNDYGRMQDFWWDVWRKPLSKPNLTKILEPFTWVVFPPNVRSIKRSAGQRTPWHQDAGFIKLLPPERQHSKIITVFLPLEEDPSSHTTLEFSLENIDSPTELTHEPKDDFGAGLNCDPKDRFHHKLSLGDALVFGDLTLHRTFTPPNCRLERRSLEFRLCIPSDGLREKDYFDITSGMFVTIDGSQKERLSG